MHVSKGYFQVFGVSPFIGRMFATDEDLPGGPKVAVISYAQWQSHFGGGSGLVGRPGVLSGESYTVIGILPQGFHPEGAADIWIPEQWCGWSWARASSFRPLLRMAIAYGLTRLLKSLLFGVNAGPAGGGRRWWSRSKALRYQ